MPPTLTLPTFTPPMGALAPGQAFEVRLHPDGPLYVGDQVSFEVVASDDVQILPEYSVSLDFVGASGPQGVQSNFNAFGIGGRQQATLMWEWDTSGLPAGAQTITFTIQPDGQRWTQSVTLLPQQQAPFGDAQWAQAETDCCLVTYITGTEAERDLPELLEMVDAQAADALQRLPVELKEPIQIFFMPRVLGHGGFASNEIAVSYLDHNYAGNTTALVVHHEIVHILDARLGGELRPSMLVEGLAVYLSGGHFKPEVLMPRAAALLSPEAGCTPLAQAGQEEQVEVCGLGLYAPLSSLVDRFYFAQHEIGYLEAAALIEFMVDTWGWESFSAFYRDIHPPATQTPGTPQVGGYQYQAMDEALRIHFGITFAQLEQRYQAALRSEMVTPDTLRDVQTVTQYYDTLRRYQKLLDPSAYFMSAWLPDTTAMRDRGIVADFVRHPMEAPNIEMETLLVQAFADLLKKNYTAAQETLAAVNAALDQWGP